MKIKKSTYCIHISFFHWESSEDELNQPSLKVVTEIPLFNLYPRLLSPVVPKSQLKKLSHRKDEMSSKNYVKAKNQDLMLSVRRHKCGPADYESVLIH